MTAPSLPAEAIAEVPIWFVRMANGQPWFGDGSSAYVWSNEDAGRRALLVFGNYYPVLKGAAVEKVDLSLLLRAASERDAAVREVEAMKRLLAELADNLETTTQDSFLRGGGWQGSEDCLGIERARAALASAAQGGANG